MRVRKLLLVHSGRSIRALIKKYIFAELSDIEIAEAGSGQEALVQLEDSPSDIIISAEHLKDMALEEFAAQLDAIKPGSRMNLIVISDSESDQAREALLQKGFRIVVQIRLRPADLIESINLVCDPRRWRKNTRYHIPDTDVIISSPYEKIEGALINFSLGGVLVELTTENPNLLMDSDLSLSMKIPFSENAARIDDLTAKLLRIDTVAWTKGHLPKTMRASFIFVDLTPVAESKLAELIQMAKKEKLEAATVFA
ncbi:MAG: hypothetical protein P8X96_15120 [Desulfobacteraceae bacterium]